MTTLPHPCLEMQASEQSQPSVPPWFAETVLLVEYLRTHGLLDALTHQIHLVRGRFGQYEVLDFLALLFGYAISGERTLQAYFDRLKPFAGPFMALFERNRLPHRTSLGRFLAAVDPSCLEAFRTLFVSSAFTWGWTQETIGGVWDRTGRRYLVFDIDGTREAARQRTLPSDPTLPPPRRRLEGVCGPGYLGRQRGEVVRTRTTILQMHTRQWLGTFGGRGNGDYRGDLTAALKAISAYLTAWHLLPDQAIVRVDGQYGDGVVIADILATGVQIVGRCRTYSVLDHPAVRLALTRAPVAVMTAPESQISYEVFEAALCLDPDDLPVRVMLTRRPWRGERVPVGKHVGEWVYEVFVTSLPADGFCATDVLDLYHGRGAFEGTLADEDVEGDPDRWCSFAALGQELWQVVWQWVWNLRLVLGRLLEQDSSRSIDWALAMPAVSIEVAAPPAAAEAEYGPLEWAENQGRGKGGFRADAFTLREDGLLQCPAGKLLRHSETRQETPSIQRLIYVAADSDCAECALRTSCLSQSASGKRGRRVSARRRRIPLLRTSSSALGVEAIRWNDVAGRRLRRTWMSHWRSQAVTIEPLSLAAPPPPCPPRAARAHRRLSWEERWKRNARGPLPLATIHLAGVPQRLEPILRARE